MGTNLLEGMGASYAAGTAAHLDLVQEPTKPRWSDMKREESVQHDLLLAADLPFLATQLKSYPFDAAICTSATVTDQVLRLLRATVTRNGSLGREQWWAGHASVDGRHLRLAGFNLPLHQPTGLAAAKRLSLP